MDYLILGGFGYLGSRIVDHFSEKGVNITIGTNASQYKKLSDIEIIKDYRKLNVNQLSNLLIKYDVVFDCSGISGTKIKEATISEIIKINSLWPIKLAKACIKSNTKLIWFSTIHCENFTIEKKETIRDNIYKISKKISEDSILEIQNWEKHITLIRLGNVIGSPGRFFNGNSNLFPLYITKKLLKEGKAIIKTDPNNEIGFLEFPRLLNSKFLEKPGFHSLYNSEKNTLYSIAKNIQNSYENLTDKKSKIIYEGNVFNKNEYSTSKLMKKEIDLMVKYFLNKS